MGVVVIYSKLWEVYSPSTKFLMLSTTSGLASVMTLPTSPLLEMAPSTLRMILPERVLGMSGTIHTFLGFAIFPICSQIASEIFWASSGVASTPGLRAI